MDPGQLIGTGTGTEAKVYALDENRVLKIYAEPDRRTALETLRDFYDRLESSTLNYALPRIHDIHSHGDLLAVVERRIDGVPMQEYVTADAADIEELYLAAASALGTVTLDPPLGHHLLLASEDDAVEPENWHAFPIALITRKLPAVLSPLREDIPDIDNRVSALLAAFATAYDGPVGVIHGDLYPGNILMTGLQTVSGVIDFGTFTMIGDSLYDVASACGFYRMYDADHADVREHLLKRAADTLTPTRRPALTAFLLTGALLSCDLYPKPIWAREGSQ